MKLPIQAQPVMRMLAASVGVNASYGVFPSDNCGRGKWCCSGLTGTSCRPCATGVFGVCIEPAVVTCALFGEIPSSSC